MKAMSVENWNVSKKTVRSRRGVVCAQNVRAAAIGAEVMERGGNAIDAAIAAGFAVSVLEPWMSGIGGGAFMQIFDGRDGTAHTIDAAMIAPGGIDPADYPIEGATGPSFFGWPKVKDDRNLKGYHSICVPGYVAGMGLALERFGSVAWGDLVAPAAALAEEGWKVDWPTTLYIAGSAAELAEFPQSKAMFLPNGYPAISTETQTARIANPALGRTLRTLAAEGAGAFYEGPLAEAIVEDMQAGGSRMTAADLNGYRARVVKALRVPYRGVEFAVAPGLSGGPTFARAFEQLSETLKPGGGPDGEAFLAYARALSQAFRERLTKMGDGGLSGDPKRSSSTTHVSAMDADGNAVSLTQTLLSGFGSKVTLPQTGIIMNNAMMWFDPEPGSPNAIRPGTRPLANMCPVLGIKDGKAWFALGASGGRRIIGSMVQIASFLADFGMDAEAAIHQPRIDVSGRKVVLTDTRLEQKIVDTLKEEFPIEPTETLAYPLAFSIPNLAIAEGGELAGLTHFKSPSSATVAAD